MMPTIRSSPRFKKAYRKLPAAIQARVKKALLLLAANPRHPSLQAKPLQGSEMLYEARVDQNYHLTYERLPGDVLHIRNVGKHDETLKNP